MKNPVDQLIINKLRRIKEISEKQQCNFIEEVEHRPDMEIVRENLKKNIQDSEILSQHYQELIKTNRDSFETIFTGLDLLMKNSDATNDKFELVVAMVNELNQQLMTVTKQQLETNTVDMALLQKSLVRTSEEVHGR